MTNVGMTAMKRIVVSHMFAKTTISENNINLGFYMITI